MWNFAFTPFTVLSRLITNVYVITIVILLSPGFLYKVYLLIVAIQDVYLNPGFWGYFTWASRTLRAQRRNPCVLKLCPWELGLINGLGFHPKTVRSP